MAEHDKEFHTVRGYALLSQEENSLTPSMEDYLEMACRLKKEKGYTRMGDLAEALNVQPPSASKMVQKLAEMGYLDYQRYSEIEFTEQGSLIGEYLLKRHDTIEKLLTILGVKNNILEDTEKLEHNISEETLKKIKLFVNFFEENPSWIKAFQEYVGKINK